MYVISPTKSKAHIRGEETIQRAEIVRVGDAENRLEGQFRGAETDPIFDAYRRGDIDVTEIVPRLKQLYKLNCRNHQFRIL